MGLFPPPAWTLAGVSVCPLMLCAATVTPCETGKVALALGGPFVAILAIQWLRNAYERALRQKLTQKAQ